MDASELYFVYVTCRDLEQARSIGEAAVIEGLAACANILPGMQSIYFWDGALQHDQECVLILKTRALRFATLRDRIISLHSYQNPCIVAWTLADGAAAYLHWLRDSTTIARRPE